MSVNNIHDNIKVDLRYSKTEIEFLDVIVRISGQHLTTDLYTKPTDTKAYLHYCSDHPSHIKKAIPTGLAMRAKRICSFDSDFEIHANDLCKKLVSRGYPGGEVRREIEKVRKMERVKLLEGRRFKQKEGVPLVVTYSSHLPNINRILISKSHILKRSRNLDKLSAAKSFAAYRRGTNLADILVHKKRRGYLARDKKRGLTVVSPAAFAELCTKTKLW